MNVPPQAHFNLTQSTHWTTTLFNGLAMSFITISIFELIKLLLHKHFMVRDQKPFEEFFGQDHSSDLTGRIIVQADTINVVMEDFTRDLNASIKDKPSNRLYKARTWINKNDMEGAKRLREAFTSMGFKPPEIVTLDRRSAFTEKVPFVVSLGLGYTDKTIDVVKRLFDDWLRIVTTSDGDAIAIRQWLVKEDVKTLRKNPIVDRGAHFYELFPIDWDLERWVDGQTVEDYGLILRHTCMANGVRQIVFLLGGFTEHGTYAAADYLATNWRSLWREHFRDERQEDGNGDFFLLIQGQSPYYPLAGWIPVPNLDNITRAKIKPHEHIDWSKTEKNTESGSVENIDHL